MSVTPGVIRRRIEIAKQAVLNLRHKNEFRLNNLLVSVPVDWAIGIIGILEYVETGDADKILLHEVRTEVKKLARGNE